MAGERELRPDRGKVASGQGTARFSEKSLDRIPRAPPQRAAAELFSLHQTRQGGSVMRIALACGLCLLAFAAGAAPRAKDEAKPDSKPAPQADAIRENFRSRMNENVVTIMAGSPTGTDLAIVQDIAEVVNGDGLRVVPMVGQGPAQNVKDVLFLRGVDMGVTQANILKYFARTGELGPNFI